MKQLMDCAMDIGEQMLLCGAEVHRVEDSVNRICHAFGAVRADVFIITSSMVLTVHGEDGCIHTQTRRIQSLGTDFHKLDRLNRLSRKICSQGMTLEEIRAELESIKAGKPYPFWVECLAYATISGSFTLFFGGDWRQFLVSVLIGIILRFVVLLSDQTAGNPVFSKFLSSFFLTAAAFFFVRVGAITSADKVIIGNIMLLIPGIGFTNALRDLFMGDSIAGALRLMEAILLAVALAAGYFLFVLAAGGVAV